VAERTGWKPRLSCRMLSMRACLPVVTSMLLGSTLLAQADYPAPPTAIEQFRGAHGEFARMAAADPPIWLAATYYPDARIHNEPGDFNATEYLFDATVPLPVSRDDFAIVGAEVGVRRFNFDGVQTMEDETLYQFGIRLGYGRFLTDDLVVQAYWQPSIYSDLGGTLNSDDYRLWYGTGLMVWRRSEGFFWKAGVRLSDAKDTGVVPLGGLTWHFADSWRLDILAPRNAEVRYTPSERWSVTAGFRAQADEYHIRGPVSMGKPEHDIHTHELTGHVALTLNPGANISTTFRVGSMLGGEYDWGYGNGLPKYDGWLSPSLFLQIELGYRF